MPRSNAPLPGDKPQPPIPPLSSAPGRPRTAVPGAGVWALAGTAFLLLLAWRLAPVLLLAFAGVLMALALLQASELLRRLWPLSPRLALLMVVLALVLLVAGGSWLAGAGVAEQLLSLRDTLPQAMVAVKKWLSGHAPGRWVLATWTAAAAKPDDWWQFAGLATNAVNATIGAIGVLVLVVAIGLYLAADPDTYRKGLLRLVPPARRPLAAHALAAAGHQLSRWLLGQGVSMLAVGLLTGLGLLLIGMPLLLPLALVAGLLEFVPYFGPMISGVFIVAVALTEGESMALWAAVVCVAVQQTEAYVVQPLAQRWAVRLPPVLGMLAVLIFGVLFGLPGALLAVPLMVLTMTLVDELYVRAALEHKT